MLDQNADAIAYTTLSLAYSTALVNGAKGRAAPGTAGQAGDAAA